MAARGAGRHDRHAEEHAIGVGEVDCLLLGAPLVGEEPHVLADDLDVVVHLAELPDPVVAEAEAHAAEQEAVTDAPRDRDQHEELLAEQGVGEFGVDLLVFPPERDQAAHLGRVLQHHSERRLATLGLGGWLRGLGVGSGLGWRRCGSIGLGFLRRGLGGRVFGPGCHARSHTDGHRRQHDPGHHRQLLYLHRESRSVSYVQKAPGRSLPGVFQA